MLSGDEIISPFLLAKRSCYLRVNLDRILTNARKLKAKCAEHTELMCVLKGNAYGHGAVPVAKHLEKNGFTNFAVATSLEGEELRQAGVRGYIQILGNAAPAEIPTYYKNSLVPTVATLEFLKSWEKFYKNGTCHVTETIYSGASQGEVVLKIDTGMSRNGCQPEDLMELYQFCRLNGIHVHSIMTQFAGALENTEFTQKQYDSFLKTVEPFRSDGVKLHVSSTPPALLGIGTDLDFIRCGISLLGHPPDASKLGVKLTRDLGLEPALAWIAQPTLVKTLSPGRMVGYGCTYTCEETETIATLTFGFGDGFSRDLAGKSAVITKEGLVCPVVGRISMDAITIKLPDEAKNSDEFIVISDDFNDINSVTSLCIILNTVPMELGSRLTSRVPRLYVVDGKLVTGNSL